MAEENLVVIVRETVEISGVSIGDKTPFVYIGRYDESDKQIGCICRQIRGPHELGQLLQWMKEGSCLSETVDSVVSKLGVSIKYSDNPRSGIKTVSLRWVHPANSSGIMEVVYRGFGHDTDPQVAQLKALDSLLQNLCETSHAHN